ncbi:MAG: 50S ribosomal protein L19e [Candidatus Thermoplasmatota archaeon]|nr:50S ribosomal protein L19e [Candidatus Thermoplasmatota archaeon]
MTDLRNQRRMAASIMKCGHSRVWMDPDRLEEIAKAVTRNDIAILVNGGAIRALPKQGNSSGRYKHALHQRQKGRRTGQGSRKGRKHARLPKKEQWMRTIRPIRSYLKQLREEKKIDAHTYRMYYQKAKGGVFRNKQHLRSHLLSDQIIKEETA